MKPISAAASLVARLALVLTLVLLGHWTALSWLSQQLPAMQAMTPLADPLFTRIIAPTPTVSTRRARAVKPRRVRAPAAPAKVVALDASTNAAAEVAPAAQAPSDLHDALAPAPVAATSAPEPAAREAPAAVAEASTPEESAAPPERWPPDTRLSYDLKGYYRGDLYGSARVQWQREQDRYQVRIDLRMALVVQVTLISQGAVGDDGLLPGAYEEQFPGSVRRLAFDTGHVRFPNGMSMMRPQALQDSASQFVDLGHRFSSGRETLQVGRAVQVWLARPQGLALWTYDVLAEETLQIPAFGPVAAFHLRPRPISNPSGAMTAEIWFAPSLGYLPVRVRIALGGDNFVDLLVARIEQGAAPAAVLPQSTTWP